MRIINKKKFYQRDINAAVRIDDNGWDGYDGRNYQWYKLMYNHSCGLVILDANNSGSCYGDYETRYFDTPASFRAWCDDVDRDWAKLLGDIDEENAACMSFVSAILGDNPEQHGKSMTREQIRHIAAWAESTEG